MGDILMQLLEYLFRVTVFTIKRRKSESWRHVTATVTNSDVPKSAYSHEAVVDYLYQVEGERFAGQGKIPFLFQSNAEICMKQFVTGAEFTVRVKPGDLSVSVIHRNYRV
jgi:hypothetical protein